MRRNISKGKVESKQKRERRPGDSPDDAPGASAARVIPRRLPYFVRTTRPVPREAPEAPAAILALDARADGGAAVAR